MINKYFKIALLIMATSLTANAVAAEMYVSDDLSIFLRRGPGVQYGLSGSLNAGDKVTLIDTSPDGKFSKVKDERGRIAWIETSALNNVPSLKIRIPQLEAQIESLKQDVESAKQAQSTAVSDLTDKLKTASETINKLNSDNSQLKAQAVSQQKEIESLNNQLDEKRQALILSWFLYGGLVAGGGLLLGIILPIIMPRRRKKDLWMN